jgi:phenylacetic acid degradation operon negative regulatory protein
MGRWWNEHTEELLDVLLWGTSRLMSPTLERLTESFEAWEWRNGGRQLRRLEQKELIQREQRVGQMVYQLTELGRLVAMGGRNPEPHWKRHWDGLWRMVVFDLPQRQQLVRQQLLRWLRQNGFGYLQNSVWIHPDPLTSITETLEEFRDDVESFTVMESRCCAGYSNEAVVRGAWDFEEINKRYETHLSQASGELRKSLSARGGLAELRRRLRQERMAWATAVAIDPLLPQALQPSDYLGQRAWQAHCAVMARLASCLAEGKRAPQ